jgi:hypothetical protein
MSDVITVPSHTKKDNPKAALKTPSAPSVTQPGPYILIPSDRRQAPTELGVSLLANFLVGQQPFDS